MAMIGHSWSLYKFRESCLVTPYTSRGMTIDTGPLKSY